MQQFKQIAVATKQALYHGLVKEVTTRVRHTEVLRSHEQMHIHRSIAIPSDAFILYEHYGYLG